MAGPAPLFWSPPSLGLPDNGHLLVSLVVACGGLIALLRAWMRLRRHTLAGEGSMRLVVLVGVVWAVPFLLTPPLASRDVYAYVAYGEMAAAGMDPYAEGPEALAVGAADGGLSVDHVSDVLGPVDPVYAESPSVYGPLFVTMSSLVVRLADGSVVASVLMFRLLAVLGLVMAGFASVDIARHRGRDPVDALMLGVFNPLVLYHLVSGAHNEALMIGFLTVGVAVGRRNRRMGLLLCALSGAIKLPGLLGAVFLAWPWAVAASGNLRRLGRLALAGLETVGVLVVFSLLSGLGWGWVTALAKGRTVSAYLSLTQLSGSGLARLVGADSEGILRVFRPVGLLVAIGFSLYVLARRVGDPVSTLAWALVVFAVLHPTTQPWYLTWGLVLLAASTSGPRNRTLVAASVVACFLVPPVGPGLGFRLIEGPGYAATLAGLAVLFALTVSPRRVLPVRLRTGLGNHASPAVVISRIDDDATMIRLLDLHPSKGLVCVMREGSEWEEPIRSALVAGSDVVIAPKDWNRIGRGVIRVARWLFPRRLRGVDPLSSTYGVCLGEVDLNRLEPNGNALLLEILVRNPSLSVVELPGHSDSERLSPGNALRYLVHLVDLRLRGSVLWGGVAGARWRARA